MLLKNYKSGIPFSLGSHQIAHSYLLDSQKTCLARENRSMTMDEDVLYQVIQAVTF